MRFKLFSACAAACACIAFLSSCGLFSEPEYKPVYTYDIGFPSDSLVKETSALNIDHFSSDAPTRYKMTFRFKDRIVQDEYRKWAQSPSSMLTKYLMLAFAGDERKPVPSAKYSLAGTLIAFEASPEKNLCRLYADCKIRRKDADDVVWAGILRIETPLSGTGDRGDDFAAAMSKAAAEMVKSLDRIVKSLPPEKSK